MTAAFQLKGGLFTLTTLQIFDAQIDRLQTELQTKIQHAPNFFENAPLVLDFNKVTSPADSIDFDEIKSLLKQLRLIPVGIKNLSLELHTAAINAGFAIFKSNKEIPSKTLEPEHSEEKVQKSQELPKPGTKIVREPIRSGQQVYAPDGDLIVTAAVSPGAELLAEGNIHIYGTLRGRALAGINGNKDVRIFCKSLEGELVSIAGHYKVSEDIDKQCWQKPVEISIQDGRLTITPI